ncbi:MAG: hypothetical protein AAFO29_09065 [Actinomycetota bacterium]
MGDPRTPRPEIVGIDVGHAACRGVRIEPSTSEIVAIGEVAFGPNGVDSDGVIEPSVVARSIDALFGRIGVQDRSQVSVGLSIGPRNAGVGSGPAMAGWLQSQATTLGQPLVCSGGLGLAFVPIRAVDQAVKTAFDVGVELERVDLAPVAAVRAVGDQVDDLICVGAGRGWQARMRDFEVLEAMENQQIGPDEPVTFHGADGGVYTLARYGWVDLSVDLLRNQQVDVGRFATAAGVAVGVLYGSPANLLDGKVINGRQVAPPIPTPPERAVRAERTLQLGVIQVPEQSAAPAARTFEPSRTGELPTRSPATADPVSAWSSTPAPAPETSPSFARSERSEPSGPAPSPRRSALATGTGPVPRTSLPRREAGSPDAEWDDDRVSHDDPINLFSPDTDEANILGRGRFPTSYLAAVALLLIVAGGLALTYLYG